MADIQEPRTGAEERSGELRLYWWVETKASTQLGVFLYSGTGTGHMDSRYIGWAIPTGYTE